MALRKLLVKKKKKKKKKKIDQGKATGAAKRTKGAGWNRASDNRAAHIGKLSIGARKLPERDGRIA